MEEFRSGSEYRFLTVGNRVVAVALRRPAHVVGNGRKTVQRLVREKNEQRWRAPSHKRLRLSEQEQDQLQKQGLTITSVPRHGQVVKLRTTSNIHTGGDAVDVTREIAPIHIEAVEAAARALPGGAVLGFDVLIPESSDVGRIGIIKINTGPMISMHHLPWEGESRNVAEAIVQAMFPALREKSALDDWVESFDSSARGSADVRPPTGVLARKIRRSVSRLMRRQQ